MKYFVKTPWWLKRLYSSYVWSMPANDKVLYLTFDDGPHPVATPLVLDELKKYDAKATFFCIGKNVVEEPLIYQRIIDEGHAVGNHTHNHMNGWKTKDAIYLANVQEAAKHITSSLFRPPYGRITSFQANHITSALQVPSAKIIMWDVLSADFDEALSPEQCLQNVVLNTRKGSVIVFHDSQKALPRLKDCLPKVLEFFSKEGYRFNKIEL